MTYRLPSGYTVHTTRIAGSTEFTTLNLHGETISVVYLDDTEAFTMHADLERASR